MLAQQMEAQSLTKVEMVKRLGTSRSQLDRLLDARNSSVTLLTLTKAAAAIGKRLSITFEDDDRAISPSAGVSTLLQ